MAEGRMWQNPQQGGKMTTAAAMAATDSQGGSKDLMSSLEKEAIEQNQACQEEALRWIIDLRVGDAVASEPALDQLWTNQWAVIITWQRSVAQVVQ